MVCSSVIVYRLPAPDVSAFGFAAFDGSYTFKSDVYSFGMMLWQVHMVADQRAPSARATDLLAAVCRRF